jgi:oxygen-independent coproporphyrinogen III oxidase
MTNIDQLRRYGLFDAKVPRYTSYPPANHFQKGVGAQNQQRWLKAVTRGSDVSVYVHIPFCKRLCWFCACRTQGTRTLAPVGHYVTTLLTEIRQVRSTLPTTIRMARLHLGGGTPTILSVALMTRLLEALFDQFATADDFEFSVEIDPTDAAPDLLRTLAGFGLNRASIGVQDFDPSVQDAIGRAQTFAQTKKVVDGLRASGVPSLNFDLLYGLPRQTAATFDDTLQQVLALRPDRVAIYGYAHVPWMSKRQVLIKDADLPDPVARFRLAEQAQTAFLAEGYLPVGIDHFALPHDSLAVAAQTGTLRRNFQGYTDDSSPTLIGFGASAISRFREGYLQNEVATSAYQDKILRTGFAGAKGYALSSADKLIADMIEQLMCRSELDLPVLLQRYPDKRADMETLGSGLLARFPDALQRRGDRIAIAPDCMMLHRIIAHQIDTFRSNLAAHSAAV